jgi:hypothetical protein
MTMTLIATANGSTINFTNIPQTGTDLYLVVSQRITDSSTGNESEIRVNGLTSGYATKALQGTGSATSTITNASRIFWRAQGGSGSTASTFSNITAYIANYSSVVQKMISINSVSENNATIAYQTILSGVLSGTAAITSLTYRDYNGATLDGSTSASLYMITKGSGGATVS